MNILRERPVVVMQAPAEEKSGLWGVFQFPKIWRTPQGVLQYRVNVAQDLYGGIGVHEPAWFYQSDDEGASWRKIRSDDVRNPLVTARLPDGTEVATVRDMVTNTHELNTQIDVAAHGLRPVFGHVSVNRVGYYEFYRYEDIPERDRTFTLMRRPRGGQWRETTGVLDAPQLLTRAVTKTRRGRDREWEDVQPAAWRLAPSHLAVGSDGALLSTVVSQASDMRGRRFDEDYCIASTDGGRTWTVRGVIANDKTLATDGYSGAEDSLVRLRDGTLLCAMRTDMCALSDEGSMYTALSVSRDDGYTWSTPRPIAESSVTPHLVVLREDVVALVHGRPGVHVVVSENGGTDWDHRVRIVGSRYFEIAEKARLEGDEVIRMYEWNHGHDSCSNTDVLPLDDSSFLIAYSDFGHIDEKGSVRKANLVQKVTVHP